MAQGIVTEFFTKKKRADPFQPSKRRKVQRAETVDEEQLKSVADLLSLKSANTNFSLKQNSEGFETVTVQSALLKPVVASNSKSSKKTKAVSTTQKKTSTRNRTTRQKSVKHGPMDTILAKNVKDIPPSQSESDEETKPVSSENVQVTSVSDDHNEALQKSLPGTPTKRTNQNSDAPIRRKRRKPTLSDLEPEKESIKEVANPEHKEEPKQSRGVKSRTKSKASVKKSLDKTFQKYESKQQQQTAEGEADAVTKVNSDVMLFKFQKILRNLIHPRLQFLKSSGVEMRLQTNIHNVQVKVI